MRPTGVGYSTRYSRSSQRKVRNSVLLGPPEESRTFREDSGAGDHRPPSQSSKIVPPTIHLGPPAHTVDTAIFEMWLGSLSTHQGLAIPVV